MCFKCLRHTYSLIAGEHISMECNPCPEGAFCPGGADIYPLEGYYYLGGAEELNSSAITFSPCSSTQACLGAIDFGQTRDQNLHAFVGSVIPDSNVLEIIDYYAARGSSARRQLAFGVEVVNTIDPRG